MSVMHHVLITVVSSRTFENDGYSCFHFLPKDLSPEEILEKIPSQNRLLLVQTFNPDHFNIGTGTDENVLKAHEKALLSPTFPSKIFSDFQMI